jgi:hypothetical protein
MHAKTPQELLYTDSRYLLPALIFVIFKTEDYQAVSNTDNTMVSYGHPVSILSKAIVVHHYGTLKRSRPDCYRELSGGVQLYFHKEWNEPGELRCGVYIYRIQSSAYWEYFDQGNTE